MFVSSWESQLTLLNSRAKTPPSLLQQQQTPLLPWYRDFPPTELRRTPVDAKVSRESERLGCEFVIEVCVHMWCMCRCAYAWWCFFASSSFQAAASGRPLLSLNPNLPGRHCSAIKKRPKICGYDLYSDEKCSELILYLHFTLLYSSSRPLRRLSQSCFRSPSSLQSWLSPVRTVEAARWSLWTWRPRVLPITTQTHRACLSNSHLENSIVCFSKVRWNSLSCFSAF